MTPQTPSFDNQPSVVLGRVAGEFTERVHRGERPDVEEYVQRHPDLADVLRRVLPALNLLGEPAAAAGPPAPARIGDYAIVREVGRGGMGIVYEATDTRLGRTVAVKLIRSGATREDIERFQTEARTAARIRHPNVVQIYDVGEHDGQPFLALEFIPGGTLSATLSGKPLAPREAAELVEVLARGVEAAHAAGVVHRDLKPANVLLDYRLPSGADSTGHARADATTLTDRPGPSPLSPAAKVSDFGLARAVDSTEHLTRSGAVLGTPSYMAPEQTEGTAAVTTAADVYALGAILYECLTGRPPFRGPTVLDTLAQVKSTDPVRPSRLQPGCPRDLETVCLKCLEKDPGRRYPSAGAVADDVRRFLDGRPVTARPLGRVARAWRVCRRNPVVAGLSAALLVLFLGGFAAVTLLWLESRDNLNLALEREGQLNDALRLAEERGRQERTNFEWAQEAVDEMLTQVGLELEDVPHADPVRRRVLLQALHLHKKFLDVRSGDPGVRLEAAQAHRRMGEISLMLGDPEAARRSAEAGLAVLRESPDPAGNRWRMEEAELESVAGRARRRTGHYRDAAALHQSSRDRFEALLAAGYDPPALRLAAAQNAQDHGMVLTYLHRYDDAAAAYRTALRHLDARPDSPENRFLQARTYNRLGTLLRSSSRLKEADQAFTEAERLLTPLVAEDADRRDFHQELASALFNHGNVVVTDGDAGAWQALALYEAARDRYRRLADDYRFQPTYRLGAASSLFGRALAHKRLGQPERAVPDYETALADYRALRVEFPTDSRVPPAELQCLFNLCDVLLSVKRYDEAAVRVGEAERLAYELLSIHPDRTDRKHGFGLALSKEALLRLGQDDRAGAIAAYTQAIALFRQARAGAVDNVRYNDSLRTGTHRLALMLRGDGDSERLAKLADEFVQDYPDDPGAWLASAEWLCWAVPLAADRPTGDVVAEAAVRHIHRSVELSDGPAAVRELVTQIRTNPSFGVLTGRPAFGELMTAAAK